MKYIMTESQLKRLTENGMNEYLDKFYTGKLNNYLKGWDKEKGALNQIGLLPTFLKKHTYFYSEELDNMSKEELLSYYESLDDKTKNMFRKYVESPYNKNMEFNDSEPFEAAKNNPDIGQWFDNQRVVETTWLIHFTMDEETAKHIYQWGFGYAVDNKDMHRLAFTKSIPMNQRVKDGYAFACDTNEPLENYYISNAEAAILFVSSGLKIHHKSDGDDQVIFKTSDAKNLVLLVSTYDGWSVIANDGRSIFTSPFLKKVINWVKTNYTQYHKSLSHK